jgi:hypothetical protein
MAGSTQVLRAYPFSDFPNGKVNTAILSAEIEASSPAISQPLASASLSGTTCSLYFNALLLTADETQLNVLVAAHQGEDFESAFQRASVEAEGATNDTTVDVEKVSLATGPLPEGRYSVTWYAEVAASSVLANTGASVGFTAAVNGGAAAELGRTANDLTTYVSFAGAYSAPLKAGESLTLAILFKRLGASSNPAKVRRARIFVSPQGT